MIRRAFLRYISIPLGYVQAWLAEGYNAGNALERCCILPAWAVFRLAFIITFYVSRLGTKPSTP